MKIPNITLLAVTTTVACTSSIHGNWTLNQVCIDKDYGSVCRHYSESSDSYTMLLVEKDGSGSFIDHDDLWGTNTYLVKVEHQYALQYDVQIYFPEGHAFFECIPSNPELNCTLTDEDDPTDYFFSRRPFGNP